MVPTLVVSIVLHISIVTNYCLVVSMLTLSASSENMLPKMFYSNRSTHRYIIFFLYHSSQNNNVFLFCAPSCLLVALTFSTDFIVSNLLKPVLFPKLIHQANTGYSGFVCFHYPNPLIFFQMGVLEEFLNVQHCFYHLF